MHTKSMTSRSCLNVRGHGILNKVIPSNRKHLCQVHRRTHRTTLLPFSTSTASPVRSPRKQKREKKPNFSEVENVALLEKIGMEKTLLMSHFQNGVTLKKNELMWRKIYDKVNAVGGNGRTVAQVKKRWKDMKQAVLERQRKSTATGWGGSLPEVPYEELVWLSSAPTPTW